MSKKMLKIPLFVLVLQIGFNAALNSRGYNSKQRNPSPRFLKYGKTRRLPEYDSYRALSSRGIPASDSEESDSEYSSFEDYSFKSVWPLQSRPYLRRNDYVGHKNRLDNDVSLESVPISRIGSNSYSPDSLQSSSSLSRQADANFRRPYLRHRPSNLRQSQTRKNYRKANYDLSLEVSSVESSNPEDPSRLGEEANYLRSLFSLIEKPNNRRDQNRKYYNTEDNMSLEVSPIDKLEADDDAINSLPNFPYQRRNNRIEYNNQKYNSRSDASFSAHDINDADIDTILLVTDDEKSDERTLATPKLENLKPNGPNNKLYNRRFGDEMNLNVDISNNLSPFRGLKPRIRKLTNDNPLTRRYNRKNYGNTQSESSLNSEMLPESDNSEQLTILRLSSLEDLSLESPLPRSSNQKEHNNRQNNHRNFLRLSLSPDNKLTLDEGVASDLSKLLSETLDELNLVPVNFRRSGSSNSKYSKQENNRLNTKENSLSNLSVLRLGSLDVPNANSLLRSYSEPSDRSSSRNLRRIGINDDPARNLEPYQELKIDKSENRRYEDQYKKDEFPDEFSLDTLFAFKKEDYDGSLDLNDNVGSNIPALRLTNQDDLSLESFRSSDENQSKQKETTDGSPHLEFPWNDRQLSNKDLNSSISVLRDFESQLRSGEKTKRTDSLNLEYPWNDILSSDDSKSNKFSLVPALRAPSQFRSLKQKDNNKDTTDSLNLKIPWNVQLSPDNDKSSKVSVLPKLRSPLQLLSQDKNDNTNGTTDSLHLKYSCNGQLSSDDDKSNKQSDLPKLRSPSQSHEQNHNTKDTSDTLHLEFPWNDQPSPNAGKNNNISAFHKSKSELRGRKETNKTKNTSDSLNLEFPWNNILSSNDNKISKLSVLSKLRSPLQLLSKGKKDDIKDTTDSLQLEFPWNGKSSSENVKSGKLSVLSKLRSPLQLLSKGKKDDIKNITDSLHLEFPWNGKSSSDDVKISKLSVLSKLRSPLQLLSKGKKDDIKDTTDSLQLEFPWNGKLITDDDKSSKLSVLPKLRSPLQLLSQKQKDDTKDTNSLHLECPWNDQQSSDKNKNFKFRSQPLSDSPRYKESKDELKLEFPWNDKTSPNKPSKKTAGPTPDPFYVHPYLRSRNLQKHPNYYSRPYDNIYKEDSLLNKPKNCTPESGRRITNRRLNKNQSLGMSAIARSVENDTDDFKDSDEDPADVITFPLDRRPQRLRTLAEHSPPVATTTNRPRKL